MLAAGPEGLSYLDNGSCYRSKVHGQVCRELGLRHLRTRPYRPRTNGKAERFIHTCSRIAGPTGPSMPTQRNEPRLCRVG